MTQSKNDKKMPSTMVRVSQEAANRLEAETLRRSIKQGIVLSRSSVLDEFIKKYLPQSDHPLIDTENKGAIGEVTTEKDKTGKETS